MLEGGVSPTESSAENEAPRQEVNLQKPPIPISREMDLALSQHKSTVEVDRSNWRKQVLEKHPEVKKMREVVNPLTRAATFARLYLPENRMVNQETVLSLISQHLRTLGLVEAQATLHEEWDHPMNIPHQLDSQLSLLTQRAVKKVGKFYDLTLPSIHAIQDPKQKRLQIDAEVSTTIGSASKSMQDTDPLPLEKPGDSQFIKTEDGSDEPIEASLNQMIYYVTEKAGPVRDELMKAMCLTISSYTSNKVFLKKISDRIKLAMEKKGIEVIRCIKLLQEWVDSAQDFLEPEILDSIGKLADSVSANYRERIFKNRQTVSPLMHLLEGTPEKVELGNIKSLWTSHFSILDLPASELARQLTVWSYTRFYSIRRQELLDGAWEKPRLKHRSPNVIAMTAQYNKMSNWVAASILQEGNLAKRRALMSYFVDLMQKLFDFQNFFGMMGVLGGLDSNPLFRLNVHWSLLPQQDRDTLERMRKIGDPDKVFATLRRHLDDALKSKKPALPFMGVLLSDLFKFDDATQPFVDGLMNVRRIKKLYQMITGIEEFGKNRYMFLPIDQVQRKLDQLEAVDDDTLADLSVKVEPMGATCETDLFNEE